jgi:hypothetical protein
MTTYIFNNFNYVDKDIILPKGTIFFRGIDKPTANVIQDRPMYLSSLDIANHYGEKVYALQLKDHLKLVDLRKLRHLLRLVITSRTTNEQDILNCVYYITIAFGLCSYNKQIELFDKYTESIERTNLVVDKNQLDFVKQRIQYMKNYDFSKKPVHPFEIEGVRIAETYIDNIVMLVLKELFHDVYDGIIAPRMLSPFHEGDSTHEEIIIFNPTNDLELYTGDIKQIETISIDYILNSRESYKSQQLTYKNYFNRRIFKGGSNLKNRDDFYKNKKNVAIAKGLATKFSSFYKITKHVRKPTLELYGGFV